MMPIPTIHTNDEHNKSILPSSLSVPKTPRKGPRKRIFQEDQLGDFLERDRITDFASLSQADCLPGFTELSPDSQEVSANVAGYVARQSQERIDCTECAGKVESKGRSTIHSSYINLLSHGGLNLKHPSSALAEFIASAFAILDLTSLVLTRYSVSTDSTLKTNFLALEVLSNYNNNNVNFSCETHTVGTFKTRQRTKKLLVSFS